jgi:Family of unknown function (DUF5684)
MLAILGSTTSDAAAGGIGAIGLLIYAALIALYIAASWKIFTKAGRSGWLSLIPIVNTVVLCRIAGKSGWWFLLLLIPVVNVVFGIMLMLELSKAFGHGAGFALGLLFLSFIFWPILAFGSSQYQARAV